MVTKCYLLDKGIKTTAAISRVTALFPCFIDMRAVSATRFEFYVKCRPEDVRHIERILSPFI